MKQLFRSFFSGRQVLFSLLSLFLLAFFVQILVRNSAYFQAIAQCIDASNPRADYLITSSNQSDKNNFKSRIGTCIIDPKAAIGEFRQTTYAQLFDEFYNKSRVAPNLKDTVTGNLAITSTSTNFQNGHILKITGDLYLDGTPSAPAVTTIVFVEGNMYVRNNFNYEDNNHGIVFIVKGGVYFQYGSSGTKANSFSGVIIAQGDQATSTDYSICTATDLGAGNNCPTSAVYVGTDALVVSGGLVNLSKNKPIRFTRRLVDNSVAAAEQINQQTKYLVILNYLLARPTNIVSEGTGYAICSSTEGRPVGCSCTVTTDCITGRDPTPRVTCQAVGASSQKVCQQTGDLLPGGATPAPVVTPTPNPAVTPTPTPTPFPPRLVVHWKFDEPSGLIAYDSAGSSNGSFYGSTVLAGRYGYARSFYTGTLMSANNSPVFGSQSTSVSMWIYPKSFDTNNASLYNYRNGLNSLGFNLQLNGSLKDGSIDCQLSTRNSSGAIQTHSVTSATKVNMSQWNHVVCTYDSTSGNAKIYINNTAPTVSATVTAGQPLNIPTNPSVVVGKNIITNAYFLGRIDDIRIYSYALSIAEINAIFSAPLSPAPSSFTNPWKIFGIEELVDFVNI